MPPKVDSSKHLKVIEEAAAEVATWSEAKLANARLLFSEQTNNGGVMPVNKASGWAARTKEATSAVSLTGNGNKGGKKDYGTRYDAIIESVTPTVFKTGGFGLKFKYAVNGEKFGIYENVVLKTLSAEGSLQPTKFGLSTLKHRLTAAGLTADEINQISFPENIKNLGNLPDLSGARVTVFALDEQYMGRTTKNVRMVQAAEAEQGQGAGGNAA